MPAFPLDAPPPLVTHYSAQQRDLLRDLASRYIWWESVPEALLFPERILAQVMNLGTYEDLVRLFNAFSVEELRYVVIHAEPGWFNERSWAFWHVRLGLTANTDPPPPLPARTFPA
jgi:hypothetical protein